MPHYIFILSDGTGRTAEQSVRAALTQYKDTDVRILTRAHIRYQDQVTSVISEAATLNAMVVHTVVSQDLRDTILHQGRLHDVETIDMMGPLLAQLSHHISHTPSETPGMFHELNKSYFQRIEALEFTFRHDDGQHVDEIDKAEIVILGVSRTFKTPLSIYLAFKGWMVANVPIILDMEHPDNLNTIAPDRVFGLTTRPNRLAELRKVRHEHLGGATGEYASLAHVQRELRYAHTLYKNHPKWKIIDVTNKPIEEIAAEIIASMREK